MQIFVADQSVSYEIEFLDGYDFVTPTSASYRILDEDDDEVAGNVEITPTDSSHLVTIQAEQNALAEGSGKGLRRIEVSFVTPEGKTITSNFVYVIVDQITLKPGANSFATTGRIMIASTEIGSIEAFNEAPFADVQIALAQAWRNIGRLNIQLTVNGEKRTSTRLLTAEDLAVLNKTDLSRLIEAQIVEADFILGGNPVEMRRRMGLMSESIGEVSQFFRTSKPLIRPVCDEVMRILSPYISNSIKLGRA